MARESKRTEAYEFDRMGGFLGNTPSDDKPGYPSLGDFADALYWKEKGDDSHWNKWVAACEKVKSDFPKV